jgi:hypothetical protein
MPLALLAACNEEPTDDGRAASGEVLEGTISDAMLPLDRVQSEPPLEDPEAFAEVQEEAAADAPDAAATDGDAEGGAADSGAADASEAVVVPPLEPAD